MRYVLDSSVALKWVLPAMEIAISTKQAVDDCIYLALAEAEGCEWVDGR